MVPSESLVANRSIGEGVRALVSAGVLGNRLRRALLNGQHRSPPKKHA